MPSTQVVDSPRLIGKSGAMQQLYKMIGRVCNVDCALLLIGEPGAGKEMIGRAIHYFSHRASAPFHLIHGNEITESYDEDILGISEQHENEATCYITELPWMPPFVHHQLVRIHRSKQYKCSHETKYKKHNLRFMVAVTPEFRQHLESGRMPVDLFYEWNFLPLHVPPLRQRKEDIPLLARYFLEASAARQKVSPKELSPEAVEILLNHDWPGNLNELRQAMELAHSNCRGSYVRAEHLPTRKQQAGGIEAFDRIRAFVDSKLSSYILNSPVNSEGNIYHLLLPQMERSLFEFELKKSKGNRNKAAHRLGLHRNTLNKKLQKVSS